MNLFARFVPEAVRDWKRAVDATRPLHPRTCPLCAFHGEFHHAGRPPRLDALCPQCGSMERHRLQWLYLRDAALQGPIVHAAPEPCLSSRLRSRFGTEYRTSDFSDLHARELHFGQDDHVRFHGRDFVTRLQAAGFEVDEHTAEGPDCVTFGLLRGEKFHVCTRR